MCLCGFIIYTTIVHIDHIEICCPLKGWNHCPENKNPDQLKPIGTTIAFSLITSA